MRATRAYIAGAGTAVVMLGASVAMFVLVSAFVAFGSWPGTKAASQVDSVVLREVAKPTPKKVTVSANAVQVATRLTPRRQVALAKRGSTTARANATIPAGNRVAKAPATTPALPSAPVAGTPVAAAPVKQQAQNVKQQVDSTTQQVGSQVQQVQTQVNQVVDQVVGGTQTTTDTTVQQAQGTAGGLLGH